MATPVAVQAFIAALMAQEGLPYVWPDKANGYSGKGMGVRSCFYPEGRDCSGLIGIALFAAGDDVDRRESWNAHRYLTELPHVAAPETGDLVVYVNEHGRGVHIEAVLPDGGLYGAIGGDPDCLTPGIARTRGARVQFRVRPRTDGRPVYLRNPLRPEETPHG